MIEKLHNFISIIFFARLVFFILNQDLICEVSLDYFLLIDKKMGLVGHLLRIKKTETIDNFYV